MDNREDILDALNDFSRKQPKEIPPLLEQFLKQVAKTGETLFPWTMLKALFVAKLEQVMADFNEECIADELPSCPNVENARFEVYRARIMDAVHKFHGAPFTIQRLCELLTDPKRHYKRCDKFMRGLEKNVMVVSTVDPFGKKVVSESKNLVNGMDGNNSSGDDTNSAAASSSYTSTTPPVPSWPSSSSTVATTAWPVNADLITPSTAPLLEVCDLPDPKEPSTSTATTTSATATPSSTEPSPVNSHDPASSVEITTANSTVTSTQSPELSVVTSIVETVDSSHQQVAAEEMVGTEEEAATSTAISQEAAGMVEEVVETPPVVAEVMKETSDMTENGAEITPAASGDWLTNITDKAAEAESSSVKSQDSSNTKDLNASDAEPLDSSGAELHDSLDAESQDKTKSQGSSSAEPEASSEQDSPAKATETSAAPPVVLETAAEHSPADSPIQKDVDNTGSKTPNGEGQCEGEEKVSNSAEVGGSVDASQTEVNEGSSSIADDVESSTDAKAMDKITEKCAVSEADAVATDASASSSAKPASEELGPLESVPDPETAEADMAPTSTEISTSSDKTSPSSCLSETSDSSAASANTSETDSSITTTTSTTTLSSTVCSTSSTEEKSEDNSVTDSCSTTCMETDSADSSSSEPKAAESSKEDVVASSSESTGAQQEIPSTDSSQAEPMEQD